MLAEPGWSSQQYTPGFSPDGAPRWGRCVSRSEREGCRLGGSPGSRGERRRRSSGDRSLALHKEGGRGSVRQEATPGPRALHLIPTGASLPSKPSSRCRDAPPREPGAARAPACERRLRTRERPRGRCQRQPSGELHGLSSGCLVVGWIRPNADRQTVRERCSGGERYRRGSFPRRHRRDALPASRGASGALGERDGSARRKARSPSPEGRARGRKGSVPRA